MVAFDVMYNPFRHKFEVGERVKIPRRPWILIVTGRSRGFFEKDGDKAYLLPKYYHFNGTGFRIREDQLEGLINFPSFNPPERVIDELIRKPKEQPMQLPFR